MRWIRNIPSYHFLDIINFNFKEAFNSIYEFEKKIKVHCNQIIDLIEEIKKYDFNIFLMSGSSTFIDVFYFDKVTSYDNYDFDNILEVIYFFKWLNSKNKIFLLYSISYNELTNTFNIKGKEVKNYKNIEEKSIREFIKVKRKEKIEKLLNS